MILAEELALLALDEDGAVAHEGVVLPAVAMALTGALIVDLEQDGHVTLDDDFVIGLTGSRPTHAALAAEVDHLLPLEGRRLGTCLVRIRHASWDEVIDGLVTTGVLRREDHVLRRPTHPPTDPAAHAALIAEVRSAAMGRVPPDERMTRLLAFLGAAQLSSVATVVPAVAPGVERRIRDAVAQVPVAELVAFAVEPTAFAIDLVGLN